MKIKDEGMLVVFDGIDGTGKTTCIEKITLYLASKGIKVIKLSEPSRSVFGMAIRTAMGGKTRLSFDDELDLFINDRRWNVKNNIIPSLEKGMVVLLDRYYFSTAAYQGCREVKSFEEILKMNEEFAPVPDLVFFFFADIEKCLERIDKGRGTKSYMEKKNNLVLVNNIFSKIHDTMKDKYNSHAIDADESIDSVFDEVKSVIDREMGI